MRWVVRAEVTEARGGCRGGWTHGQSGCRFCRIRGVYLVRGHGEWVASVSEGERGTFPSVRKQVEAGELVEAEQTGNLPLRMMGEGKVAGSAGRGA